MQITKPVERMAHQKFSQRASRFIQGSLIKILYLISKDDTKFSIQLLIIEKKRVLMRENVLINHF